MVQLCTSVCSIHTRLYRLSAISGQCTYYSLVLSRTCSELQLSQRAFVIPNRASDGQRDLRHIHVHVNTGVVEKTVRSETWLPIKSRSSEKTKNIQQQGFAGGHPLLVCRSQAYVWQSGRDAQFS